MGLPSDMSLSFLSFSRHGTYENHSQKTEDTPVQEGQTCLGCNATSTPEWRRGPMGESLGLLHYRLGSPKHVIFRPADTLQCLWACVCQTRAFPMLTFCLFFSTPPSYELLIYSYYLVSRSRRGLGKVVAHSESRMARALRRHKDLGMNPDWLLAAKAGVRMGTHMAHKIVGARQGRGETERCDPVRFSCYRLCSSGFVYVLVTGVSFVRSTGCIPCPQRGPFFFFSCSHHDAGNALKLQHA